ncbi:MAG: DUF3990 domain-containing protein [Candidatus Ancillula sp.]|jgi:hypothetical protein|nr:DUF3990 domain-containing protein [Candidatus Ancillula sp.]
MLLYHGGLIEIKNPLVDFGRPDIDFGQGFYTTLIKEQAEKWAKRKKRLSKDLQTVPIVSVYNYEEDDHLFTKQFDNYSEEWLMFVIENRRQIIDSSKLGYDIIEGNIADDRVVRVVDALIEAMEEERINNAMKVAALLELEYQEENYQICFKTNKSLKYLTFQESYEVKNV